MSTCSYVHKSIVLLKDKAFYIVLASGMSRKFYGKVFNRGFNPRQYENEYCSLKNQEREMSETEQVKQWTLKTMLRQLQLVGLTTDLSTDNESETEEDPWMPLVDEAMQKHKTAFEEMKINLMQSGLDEQSAGASY